MNYRLSTAYNGTEDEPATASATQVMLAVFHFLEDAMVAEARIDLDFTITRNDGETCNVGVHPERRAREELNLWAR